MRKCIQDVPDIVKNYKLPKEYIELKLRQQGIEYPKRKEKGIEPQVKTPLKQKRSPILERTKDPDYFLEATNNKLEDIRNEVVGVGTTIGKRLDRIDEEILSTKRLVRLGIKKKGG